MVGGGEKQRLQRAQGNLGGEEHFCYLDSGDGFTGVYLCQNRTKKVISFIIYWKHFNVFSLYWEYSGTTR